MDEEETTGKEEVILRMADDEICLVLYGLRFGNDKWKFRIDKTESAIANSLSAEEADLHPTLHTSLEYVDTWEEALALLDQYLWIWLPIQDIHFDFAEMVLSALGSH